MFLKINDKGLIFNIDGNQYRTPLLMDISKRNISGVIMAIHLSGIKDFFITGSDDSDPIKKSIIQNKNAPSDVRDKQPELNDNVDFLMNSIEEKFKRFEKNLMKKIENGNIAFTEQNSDLRKLELFMKQFYDKENPAKTFKTEHEEENSFFIPDINMDMKLRGSSTETLSNKEDVGEAVNALAILLKK
jgi:hypothetical protein